MHILALSPFHGGSHRSHLAGWMKHSDHRFTVESLPAYKWKWRMRHSAITLADRVSDRLARGESFDALFCTDMLNLAEFFGLADPSLRILPSVLYFHENQLTYPVQEERERDLHFAFTNLTSALAVEQVWFNSSFHRNEFLDRIPGWLNRMPDFQPGAAAERIKAKSLVVPPGIDCFPERASRRAATPLHIVWASRWEYDKGPDDFFEAMMRLSSTGTDFRLSVVGESYKESPRCFAKARDNLDAHIEHWGYLKSRDAYRDLLLTADVVVSTAQHEFFGIAIAEAVAAGCFPIVPRRLAYPEVFRDQDDFFYDGTVAGLVNKLRPFMERPNQIWTDNPNRGRSIVARFDWSLVAATMDKQIECA